MALPLPLLSPAMMATILRPIAQLPPRQVKGSRHQLQLKHHLGISILHARFTSRSFKCPLLIAHKDRDLIPWAAILLKARLSNMHYFFERTQEHCQRLEDAPVVLHWSAFLFDALDIRSTLRLHRRIWDDMAGVGISVLFFGEVLCLIDLSSS